MNSKICIKNLSVSYGLIKAVRQISFEFSTGEITSLIGSNGAGKSTTLKALAGLLPHTGEILFDTKNISNFQFITKL